MSDLDKLIKKMEEQIDGNSMRNLFRLGDTLAVMESYLWNINPDVAQECNNIQHKIFGE